MPNYRNDAAITVNGGEGFSLENFDPKYTAGLHDEKECKADLEHDIDKNSKRQVMLYAEGKRSLLIIFQAMDAAGKDSTIKNVLTGLNPQGVRVSNFKKPSAVENAHDFLWRTTRELPERGMIGVFNRSYYEEVLVCKVHPEFVLGQNLPAISSLQDINAAFWQKRYESIVEHEKHLHRNGTTILKFFLNVSKDEQARRFLARIDDPEKIWKFNPADLAEREHWDDYMKAYEDAIRATATKRAPWFIIPADTKWFMQMVVADIIHDTLKEMDLSFPSLSESDRAEFAAARKTLS